MKIEISGVTVESEVHGDGDFMTLALGAFVAAGYSPKTFEQIVMDWLEENELSKEQGNG